jgi:glycosyltransferase involved in cell wall biosynthesis
MTNVHDRVLVIVPAWNEASSVGQTVQRIRAADPSFDVVVVNDGSTDDTEAVAIEAGATVLSLPFNLGVGGAMRTGYIFALRNGYRRAIQVDADGQHDPADIARVVAGLEHADIAIGARFAAVGTYTVRGPRRWAMIVLAKTLSRLAGTRLTDVTSGFRAANERAIVQYTRYYPAEYLGDTVDSLVAALHSGLTVTQVPVAIQPRQSGRPSNGAISATLYLIRAAFALGLALVGRRAVKRAADRSVT